MNILSNSLPVAQSAAQRQWLIKQLVFSRFLELVDQQLSSAQIRYMPIKGAYLIVTGLAGQLDTREMCDIDILVEPENFEKAVALFADSDHIKSKKSYGDFEYSFVYADAEMSATIEIHRAINFKERFDLPAERLFQNSLPSGTFRCLPSPEDALLILICHSLVHLITETPVRKFDEIAVICGQEGFLWERFWERAKGTGVERYVRLVMRNYGRVRGVGIVVPGREGRYDRWVVGWLGEERFLRMSGWRRRFLLEFPYCRFPLALMAGALGRKIRLGAG